ncbi:FAD-dependent oxidoreductase [Vannielia litorea]|uniref:FAD-dependent oxidoreductase n=1 Tax=Vannielia litorea TaxID=1217970 RepID=UPI001C948CDF|nr:FAD-dependent oxidoreductase [Vannielia litorea]MBY6048759.1 FAD-dependent oxidoreductase [Vannielia litorea]MBY6076173.1 FAD-dependent oxidoreductase [Vannielia litorea]
MSYGRPINPATTVVRHTGETLHRELEVDLCVIGAGISGTTTALEAAKLGKKVAIVDGLPALGGQAVNSIIGTFCGLYQNGTHGHRYTFGIADEMLAYLEANDACYYRHGPMTTVVHYNEVALSRWVETSLDKAGVIPITGAILREVERDGRRITAAKLVTRYGDVTVRAEGFADCSGDAALAYLAGLECREPDEKVYGTQQCVVEGLNTEVEPPERDELSERIAQKAKDYGLLRHGGIAFYFPGKDVAVLNMTHMETPLDPLEASKMGQFGKEQVDRGIELLKAEYPEFFGNIRVRSYGFPGIRQTRWIKGAHHLVVDEVVGQKKFDDAIGRTAWPIELHNAPEGFVWETFDENHTHYIPFGSMICPEADNLVAVGRCIDGDPAALSSVRVMGPCMAQGMAAAQALDLAGSGSVHQLDMAALQGRLSDNLTRTDGVAP